MKLKRENTWVYVLTVLAILLSVAAIAITIPRKPEVDFDYQGVIVGILSLLVTVLIGYNVYSLIDLRGLIEQNRRNAVEIEKLRKYSNTNLGQIEHTLATLYFERCFIPDEKNLIWQSLYHWIKAILINSEEGNYDICIQFVNIISCTFSENLETPAGEKALSKVNLEIPAEKKALLKELCSSIPNKEKISNFESLVKTIDNIRETK